VVILLKLYFDRDTLLSLLAYAKDMHPREIFLVIRGRRFRDGVLVEDFLLPQSTILGEGFAIFNPYNIPIDFKIIGTVHSHPSGVLKPSIDDYNHMYGFIMVIIAYPYASFSDVAVFDAKGEPLEFEVI
jgi:proteasome lid subunit RPN8/RPN11